MTSSQRHQPAVLEDVVALQPAPLLAALDLHGVDYVVIGGVAAQLHGDTSRTRSLDITPNPAGLNLQQLQAVLVEVDAREYVPGFGYPLQLPMGRRRLSSKVPLHTTTQLGPLDVIPTPHGISGGYRQLAEHMRGVHAYAMTVPTARLADLITSHRAAGRPKDAQILKRLRALEERVRERGFLPPYEAPATRPSQPAPAPGGIHQALDAAAALATVFDDVRPAVAAGRRHLHRALDEAQYGDPSAAARQVVIARKALDVAWTHTAAVHRQLQPEATLADLQQSPVTGRSDRCAMLAYQAHADIGVARRLLAELEPHRLHTLDAHDRIIEARIHASTGEANLDLLQIKLERAARAWELPHPGSDLAGPEL